MILVKIDSLEENITKIITHDCPQLGSPEPLFDLDG